MGLDIRGELAGQEWLQGLLTIEIVEATRLFLSFVEDPDLPLQGGVSPNGAGGSYPVRG